MVSFSARPGTPALAACDVFAVFPDTTVTISGANTGRRLLTNRDRALIAYEMRTEAGESGDLFLSVPEKPAARRCSGVESR